MDTKNVNSTLVDTKVSQEQNTTGQVSFENLQADDIFNQRWKILGELGRGGFGVVYHALDLNIEGREVAIKILTVDTFKYPDALTRFKKEVSITSKLRSPNTLMVYDFGVIDRWAYMISELLIGETLEQKISNAQSIPIDEALSIIKDVAQVLAEAHQSNIVHRDIKPDNIYLNQTKDGYEVKLIDFGIAKVIEASSKATATQSFFGTPLYMSPEQIKDSSKVDAKTDIYSLGLVLYTSLVGKPPFEDHDFYQLLKKQVEQDLPLIPFSQKRYEVINQLIAEMTIKNTSQRIQTMKEVVESISWIQSQINGIEDQSVQIRLPFKSEINDLNKTSIDLGFPIELDFNQNKPSILPKISFALLLLLGGLFFMYQKQSKTEPQSQNIIVTKNNVTPDRKISKELEHKIDEANKKLLEESKILIEKANDEKIEKVIDKEKKSKVISTPMPIIDEPDGKVTKPNNNSGKYKAVIYNLIEKKSVAIKKCINVYQSDFDQEFLHLNIDFKEPKVFNVSYSGLNPQTVNCLNKIINSISFAPEIIGQTNIKILLPGD